MYSPPAHSRPALFALPDTVVQDHVTLTFPARAAHVALARHTLGALADALAVAPEVIEDVRLAVTEACTNAVRHAYAPDAPGVVEVSVRPGDDEFTIAVTDHGRGIGGARGTEGSGLGLPLIAALAREVDIGSVPGGGCRVTMTFASTPASAA